MGLNEDLASLAASQREAITSLISASHAVVTHQVNQALGPIRAMLPMLARNNPNVPFGKLWARSDVKAAWTAALSVRSAVATEINAAYMAGLSLGKASVDAQLALYRIEPTDVSIVDRAFLAELIDRWELSAGEITAKLPGALDVLYSGVKPKKSQDDDPVAGVPDVALHLGQDRAATVSHALDGLERNLAWRGRIGTSTGITAGHGRAQVSAASGIGGGYEVRKQWVNLGPDPCRYCRALHNTQVPIRQQFPTPAGSHPFGSLDAPPLHPNCRCVVRVVVSTVETLPESPAATEEGAESPPMAGTGLTASQIRDLPAKTYRSILTSLKNLVTRFRRR